MFDFSKLDFIKLWFLISILWVTLIFIMYRSHLTSPLDKEAIQVGSNILIDKFNCAFKNEASETLDKIIKKYSTEIAQNLKQNNPNAKSITCKAIVISIPENKLNEFEGSYLNLLKSDKITINQTKMWTQNIYSKTEPCEYNMHFYIQYNDKTMSSCLSRDAIDKIIEKYDTDRQEARTGFVKIGIMPSIMFLFLGLVYFWIKDKFE